MVKLRNLFLRMSLYDRKLNSLVRTNLTALDQLNLSLPVRSFSYVVFDLETTGLNLYSDQIVSVGAFRVVEGRIRLDDVFSQLVNPNKDIPPSSVKIHGIVPAMIAEAPTAGDVLQAFLAFIGSDILVAHQAHFDMHFLNRWMQQIYGFSLQNLVLDTIRMCRKITFPPHPYPYGIDLNSDRPYTLDAIAKYYGIKIQERHTALGDALATAMILQRIIAKLEKDGNDTLRKLVQAAGIF